MTPASKRAAKNAAGFALRAASSPAAATWLRALRSPGGASFGNDVEETYAEAGVGKVGGDRRAHHARSQHRHVPDRGLDRGGHVITITENSAARPLA